MSDARPANADDPSAAQEARQKLVADWLFLSHSMRTCADSINRYISFLASSTNQADFLQNIVQLPNLHSLNKTDPAEVVGGSGSKKKRGRATDEGDEKDGKGKRRREKAPKDPNAPKRPPSAYILFQNKIRESMRADNPDMPYRELVSKISEIWAALPNDEKQIYNDMAHTDMNKWREDMDEYTKAAITSVAQAVPIPTSNEDDGESVDVVPQTATTAAAPSSSESDSDDSEEDERVVAAAAIPKQKAAPAAQATPASVKKSKKNKDVPVTEAIKAVIPPVAPSSQLREKTKKKKKTAE